MTIYEKIEKALSGWVIHKVGMIDRYRYLVIGQWNNDDEKNPYIYKGEKLDHPTVMYVIDVEKNKIKGKISLDGYSYGYCDGGTIGDNKVAFFGSYNGITYYLDYDADIFGHEELLSTKERREKGISRGISDVRFIGNHFYTAYAGNQIHRRDAPKEWTLISQEPRAYCKRFGNGCDTESLDGFSEEEIYFGGHEGNLWAMLKNEWHKIPLKPDWNIENVVCADDGRVYVVDTRGRVAVGRGTDFTLIEPPGAKDALPYIREACFFRGTLYGGGAGGPLYRFDRKERRWVKADLPLIGSVEYLAAKDGVMLIAGAWTLKLYNGKETIELYGGERELNELLLKGFMQSAKEVLDNANLLLEGMKKP